MRLHPAGILTGAGITIFPTLIWSLCLMATEPEANSDSLSQPDAATEVWEAPITDSDREHWSFQPLARPELPLVRNPRLAQNAIDLFILQQLDRRDQALSAAASRGQILRRLKFDLHGLPPTVSEINAFVNDTDPMAYERLVDRLLNSPRYGERWAQHWLDLARFAETDGFEHDKVRLGAWEYRDWVILAINDDMPYDRFLSMQLAGDLHVQGETAAAKIRSPQVATMFCMAGPDMPDINEQDLRRHDKLNEITSTVGAAILGLQFHCAQCHDHKYDPISQADFYRLRAVFESSIPLMIRDQHVLVLKEQTEPQIGRVYHRGELSGAGAPVLPGVPRIAIAEGESHLCAGSTPRLEFCDWLFTDSNPLTARVIANRIWQHHFGQSLCENPSDFGVIAGGPSHPELLDWLSCELRDSGWSIKHLHRLILNSATFRQAGISEAEMRAIDQDPDNEYYGYFPTKRLGGELVRDAMLQVSGQLDTQMSGESVFPPLPPELLSTLLKGQWKTSSLAADHCRRSIYTFARRNLRYPIFDVFDRPDAGASCAVRDQSTTAIQSLLMLNSEFTLHCAEQLADLIWQNPQFAEGGGWVDDLFLRTIGRPANPDEKSWFQQHLSSGDDSRWNLISAGVALLNSNEFLYID